MQQYYNNIDDCSLWTFKMVQVKNDYKYLHISGNYDESGARSAWLNIIDEYNDAVKSNSNNILFELKKRLIVYQGEYTIIHNCLNVITELYNANTISLSEVHNIEPFVSIINKYGFKFDINDTKNEILRIRAKINHYRTKVNSTQKAIESREKMGGNWTIADTIASVQRFNKYQYNQKEISVREFVSDLNSMLNQPKPKDNGKRNRYQ